MIVCLLLKVNLENGSDMIVTIVHHLLKDFVQDHGHLPKKLHLNLGKRYLYSCTFRKNKKNN